MSIRRPLNDRGNALREAGGNHWAFLSGPYRNTSRMGEARVRQDEERSVMAALRLVHDDDRGVAVAVERMRDEEVTVEFADPDRVVKARVGIDAPALKWAAGLVARNRRDVAVAWEMLGAVDRHECRPLGIQRDAVLV